MYTCNHKYTYILLKKKKRSPFWENDKQTNLFPNIMLDMMAGIVYYVCTKPCQRSMGPIPPLSTYGFRPMAWEKRKQRIAFCLSKDNVYQQNIDQYCWFWTKDVSTSIIFQRLIKCISTIHNSQYLQWISSTDFVQKIYRNHVYRFMIDKTATFQHITYLQWMMT